MKALEHDGLHLYRVIIAIGCGLHLDYVEPQLQHDDALRAAV